MAGKKQYRSGFTLVEILMVVVIIAVLAAVIIPRFTGYVDQGNISATKTNLQTLRSALQSHYATRQSTWPSADLNELVVASGGTLQKLPKESIKGLATVVNALDGNGGWFYDTTDHDVQPNLTGNDALGEAYDTY